MNLSLGSKGLVVYMDPERNHFGVFEILNVVRLAFMTGIYCGVRQELLSFFVFVLFF